MKRVATITALTAVLSLSVTAFASAGASYNGQTANSVNVTGSDEYQTVIITGNDDNVVYVNQAKRNNLFSDPVTFLIKENPPYGKYTVRLGGGDGIPETTYFWIGLDAPTENDVPMTRLEYTERSTGDNGTKYYTAGFYAVVDDPEDYAKYKSLKVGYDNGDADAPYYGGFILKDGRFFPPSCEGSIALVFALKQVEEDEIDSVSVFLSTDELDSTAEKGSAYR